MQTYNLKWPPECVMNNRASELRAVGNKDRFWFETRHNPA
jgi:hypothetical protein